MHEVKEQNSLKVKQQYEVNPYPRWSDLRIVSKPFTIKNLILNAELKLYQNSILAYQIPGDPKDTKKWQPNIIVDQDAPGGSHYFDIIDIDNDGKQEFMIGAVGGKIFKGGHYFSMWKEGDDPEKPWKKIKHFPNQIGASHI